MRAERGVKKYPQAVTPIVPKDETPDLAEKLAAVQSESLTALANAIVASDARMVRILATIAQAQTRTVRVTIVRDRHGDMTELVITKE